jgi:hypothetical protein
MISGLKADESDKIMGIPLPKVWGEFPPIPDTWVNLGEAPKAWASCAAASG